MPVHSSLLPALESPRMRREDCTLNYMSLLVDLSVIYVMVRYPIIHREFLVHMANTCAVRYWQDRVVFTYRETTAS